MPLGYIKTLEPLTEAFLRFHPKSVLDLGIGYGMNGAVLRNYFGGPNGRLDTANPAFLLHGIEVFHHYRNPMWGLYDRVTVGDIRDSLPILGNYDLVVCTDVLEHLDVDLGKQVLMRARHAFIGVCNYLEANPKEGAFGNPHEAHVSQWSRDLLESFGYEVTELNPVYLLAVK